jgi:hypothetical protein
MGSFRESFLNAKCSPVVDISMCSRAIMEQEGEKAYLCVEVAQREERKREEESAYISTPAQPRELSGCSIHSLTRRVMPNPVVGSGKAS